MKDRRASVRRWATYVFVDVTPVVVAVADVPALAASVLAASVLDVPVIDAGVPDVTVGTGLAAAVTAATAVGATGTVVSTVTRNSAELALTLPATSVWNATR